MRRKNKRSESGFTMIEILTTLVILGVLMSISLVTYNKAKQKAMLGRVKTNAAEIMIALEDFQRDHNGRYPAFTDWHHGDPVNYTTNPAPPSDPVPGIPLVLKRRGNAIIGGGPALADTQRPLQDDFYRDELNPPSNFRNLLNTQPFGSPMIPIDALAASGQFETYPLNPFKSPGTPMVNIAHMLYEYDAMSNDFHWVDITTGPPPVTRTGLIPAYPGIAGEYVPIPMVWLYDTYPEGDFAYIPLELANEQGTYCNGYWIIVYGDRNTLNDSAYTKFGYVPGTSNPIDTRPAIANWPNFPPPYGDGDPNTPPAGVEASVKQLVYGALAIYGNIYEDQLTLLEHPQ